MSKRKQADNVKECITTPVDSITAEQLQALKDAQTWLPERLGSLNPLLQGILAAYEVSVPPHKRPVKTLAATNFKSVQEAATMCTVDFNPDSADYGLFLRDHSQEVKSLSEHYDAVISDLRSSPYIPDRTNESFSRTILDLIILDRLNALQDQTAHKRLLLGTEVNIAIEADDDGKPIIIRGRADWAIGYGSSTSNTGNLLIIAEAKRYGSASVGIPQLLIYMAAAQDDRSERLNKTIWGILSDGREFYFLCLTENRKLLRSRVLEWRFDSSDILRHIDTILRDAIQSSPHTTPQKTNNSALRSYGRYLAGSWRFGVGSKDELSEVDEGEFDLVDIVNRDGHLILREKSSRYYGISP